ncbi:MAG: hypothetical protein H7Y06_01130 [Opitutaceae bacterium]|nr:hypothetical protein [Opitutaceae bacterium]
MNRRAPFYFLALLLGAITPAAADSPQFVIQNQPAPPAATVAAAHDTRITFPDGGTLSVRLKDNSLQILRAGLPPYVLDPQAGTYSPPALDARGPHVVVAWFSLADGPRVNVSTSSNAGAQWLMPSRVDDISPIGRVSVVLLDDGAQLVSWVERLANDYVILLRRVSPRGTLSVPAELVRQTADPGHPRLTRIKDGDATPAQLLLTYSAAEKTSARLITLPSAAQLAEADACDCDPRPEDQRGYAIKGRIVSIQPDLGTLTLAHDAVPGVLKATTTTLHAAPDLLASAKTDTRILARIERLGPDWWLFNPRTLLTP